MSYILRFEKSNLYPESHDLREKIAMDGLTYVKL